MTVLVTGGTGKLGRATVPLLREAGEDVRILSRRNGPDHVVADLGTGAGLTAAVTGVSTVLHLATGPKDLDHTRRLVNALQTQPGPVHLIYVSIIGVDANPMPYYAAKLACEQLVEASGLGWTIIRVSQFHDLVAGVLAAQHRLPILAVVKAQLQPIATTDVAPRLAELVATGPSARVDDIAGPEQRTLRDLALAWQHAVGSHRKLVTLPTMGKSLQAFASGAQLGPLPGYGTTTFEEWLTARA